MVLNMFVNASEFQRNVNRLCSYGLCSSSSVQRVTHSRESSHRRPLLAEAGQCRAGERVLGRVVSRGTEKAASVDQSGMSSQHGTNYWSVCVQGVISTTLSCGFNVLVKDVYT